MRRYINQITWSEAICLVLVTGFIGYRAYQIWHDKNYDSKIGRLYQNISGVENTNKLEEIVK